MSCICCPKLTCFFVDKDCDFYYLSRLDFTSDDGEVKLRLQFLDMVIKIDAVIVSNVIKIPCDKINNNYTFIGNILKGNEVIKSCITFTTQITINV